MSKTKRTELIADRRAHELEVDAARARSAREHEQAIKEERRVAEAKRWEAQFPGITEALQTDHFIINDIRERAGRYGVSEKQAALVLKLAERVRNPPPAERYAVAPTGRVEFEGEVVSVKVKRSEYGGTAMTVKVTTADGSVWLAWGTAPAALLAAPDDAGGPRGRVMTHAFRECGFNRLCRICGLLWLWGTPRPRTPCVDLSRGPYR